MNQHWIYENHRQILRTGFRIRKILFEEHSAFQKITVVDSHGHGKMLLNDDLVMLSERDEFIYHEMIAHVPLFVHPRPQKVLVIGGGDGGTAREVMRHENVVRCVMVEIDELVIQACKTHMPRVCYRLEPV